jgi:hypothetical protein
MFVLSEKGTLQERFAKVFTYSDPGYVRAGRDQLRLYWKNLVSVANRAAAEAGHSNDPDAAWCFFVHGWHCESAKSRKPGKPLTSAHRKSFENAVKFIAKTRGKA